MSLIVYSFSDLKVFALQEFILIKPKEDSTSKMEVTLNILMNAKEDKATLFLIQRGRINNHRNSTEDILRAAAIKRKASRRKNDG